MFITGVLAALAAAAAVLLLASGAAKIVAPAATVRMLAALAATAAPRLPRRPAVLRPVARLAGLAEVGVAGLVLVAGGRVAAVLLAGAYLVFAVVALRLAAGPTPVSCGCFGDSDAPVTRAHVMLNAAVTVLAAAAAVAGVPAGGGLFDDGVLVAVAGSLLVGLLAWTAYLSITALPALSSARRLVEAP